MTTLVTTTFYKSPADVRFTLVLRMLEAANTCNYTVVVVDGSPVDWVQQAMEQCGAIVVRQQKKGMGASRRQALRVALDDFEPEVLVWLEPEKAPIVPLLAPVVKLIADEELDIVLPRRNELDSYPEYQQLCEYKGNWTVGQLTGRPDLDFWFGPKVMSRRIAELFLNYDGEYGDTWDSILVPVVRVIAEPEKYMIGSMAVDYIHPPEQTKAEIGDAEMNRKRDLQLKVILAAMRAECSKLGLPIE